MKPILERILRDSRQSFHCEVVRGRDFGTPWHFHPEIELTLTLKGRGHRMIGDDITSIVAGDLVLLGANLPHVWHQDLAWRRSQDAAHALVIQFTADFLGPSFMTLPEMLPTARLLERAGRGLAVTGRTRGAVSERMRRIVESEGGGLGRLTLLLEILDILSRSRELKPICSPGFFPQLALADQDRMARVFRHIHEHLGQEIDRDRLASLAGLSAGAFSRFFKTRTGKTVPRFVNELRVGRACRRLTEGQRKIATIAMECGYGNLSNFNRQFMRMMRVTPLEYRRRFSQVSR
jgi:AraC-like DNA-binding protein